MDIEFRDIKRQDIEELVKLCSGIGGYNLRYESMSERVKEVMKSQNGTVIVAVDNVNSVIGWIQLELCTSILTNKCCKIYGLFVDSKYRGRKIGQMLLEKAKEWALSKECSGITILSDEKRIDSHNFYTHQGFTHTKNEETFHIDLEE